MPFPFLLMSGMPFPFRSLHYFGSKLKKIQKSNFVAKTKFRNSENTKMNPELELTIRLGVMFSFFFRKGRRVTHLFMDTRTINASYNNNQSTTNTDLIIPFFFQTTCAYEQNKNQSCKTKHTKDLFVSVGLHPESFQLIKVYIN
jgi:hypothetical protein